MNTALKQAEILLPSQDVDLSKWAVVACDQYTSQPKYWKEAEAIVGDAPSTLNLIVPEAFLSEQEERVLKVQSCMQAYLDQGVISNAVHGFVLTQRQMESSVRIGLLVSLDLECYDYHLGAQTLIRSTEQTVEERVPPRARVRAGAALELPHILMLIDDPEMTVIEPVYHARNQLKSLYDFDLMLNGGHLQGWAVEGEMAVRVIRAMEKKAESCEGLLYAVGDGNHSLAAAKQCWENIKGQLTEQERENHPARYVLAELVNLASPAMKFEPIHRIVFHADYDEMIEGYRQYLQSCQQECRDGEDVVIVNRSRKTGIGVEHYPLEILQQFLDQWLKDHPESRIDYIHGEDALIHLLDQHEDAVGFMPRAFRKEKLFETIRRQGSLPRKTFSIGEANEKRYYMECRMIR